MLELSCATVPGAGRKIIRCELSVDGCKTWRLGTIHRAGPPNEFGRHWAWVFWEISIPLSAHPSCLLQALLGEPLRCSLQHGHLVCAILLLCIHTFVDCALTATTVDLLRCEELVCRAWDEAMNTQPNMLTWNLMGAFLKASHVQPLFCR